MKVSSRLRHECNLPVRISCGAPHIEAHCDMRLHAPARWIDALQENALSGLRIESTLFVKALSNDAVCAFPGFSNGRSQAPERRKRGMRHTPAVSMVLVPSDREKGSTVS